MIAPAYIAEWRSYAPWSTDAQVADAGPIGAVMSALRARLDPWLGKPKREQTAAAVRLTYRFASELPPVTPLRLKVEINTREHIRVLPLETRPFAVESRWFTGRASIRTYGLEELLGTKLRSTRGRRDGTCSSSRLRSSACRRWRART